MSASSSLEKTDLECNKSKLPKTDDFDSKNNATCTNNGDSNFSSSDQSLLTDNKALSNIESRKLPPINNITSPNTSEKEEILSTLDKNIVLNETSDIEKDFVSDSISVVSSCASNIVDNSAENNNAVSVIPSDFEKKSCTNSSIKNLESTTVSEKDCVDENLSPLAPKDEFDIKKHSLEDNNQAISCNVPDAKEYSSNNSRQISADTPNSVQNFIIDDDKAISNELSDSRCNYMVDDSTELNEDVSNSLTSNISSSKQNVIMNDSSASNDISDSEKNAYIKEVPPKDTFVSRQSSLTDNDSCISNDASDSEKISSNNNLVSNDALCSEKLSLSDSHNSLSNDVSESEKISSSTNNNNESSNDASDSEISSNLDLNVDNSNDNTRTTNLDPESEISNVDSETEKTKDPVQFSYEAIRHEYEDVLRQCRVKLESLGKDNINLRHEVADLKIKLCNQEMEYKKQEAKMKAEYLTKIEKLSRECNTLRKEKEAIVIRYANSEKEVIKDKKIQQELEKKIRDMIKDRENLLLKLKNAAAENSKLSSSVENKMVEIAKLQKENEKLNADFNSREIRIKWLQNKLKTEASAHQETQTKLEHTTQRLNEMKEEAEQIRKDCQDMIKCYQEDEEIKSVKLDSQLKQKLSELEVQKQEKSDQEQVYILLRQELDALKKKQRLTMEDNNSLTLKINSLEKERLEYEQTLCKLKDSQNLLKEEIADLTSRLAEMEGLKLQLEQEKEKSAATLREVERLRSINAELQSDLDACHVKEGDRLDFIEKLTAKTMLLQSDHCLLEVKAQAMEDEVNQLKKSLSEVEQNYSKLLTECENSKIEHENEMQLLVQKLAESAKNVEKLNTHLEEAENENRVLKRRHIASIKELSRELYQCKRRLEVHESSCGIRADSVSLGSRTSSSASLHISNSNDSSQTTSSPSLNYNSVKGTPSHQEKNGSSELTVDKEVLINRIIHLQKQLVKKTDKIDFLEDHIEHLVREMRKKSRTVDFKNV